MAEHFFFNIGGSTLSTVFRPDLMGQDLDEDWGKIHRLREDGSDPDHEPHSYRARAGPTSIWSFGHRDAQGLDYDPATGELVAVEHGPQGGDELNVIQPGQNYGWPLFSYGIDYSGAPVSSLDEATAALAEPSYPNITGRCHSRPKIRSRSRPPSCFGPGAKLDSSG